MMKNRRNWFTFIWTVLFFCLALIAFLFPYVVLESKKYGAIPIYKSYDFYYVIGTSISSTFMENKYIIGTRNFSFLWSLGVCFLILILISALFILLFNKKIIYILRLIFSILNVVVWTICLIIWWDISDIGMIIIIVVTTIDLLGLFLISKNRYHKIEINDEKIFKNGLTFIWSMVFFVITMFFFNVRFAIFQVFDPDFMTKYMVGSAWSLINSEEYLLISLLIKVILFIQISILILSIILLFKNNKVIFMSRNIIAYLAVLLGFIILIIYRYNFCMGQMMLLLTSCINALGLTLIKDNKYKEIIN